MPFLTNRFWKLLLAITAIYVILHFVDEQFHILPVAPHIKQIAWTVFLISGTILLYMYAAPLLKNTSLHTTPSVPPGALSQQIKVLEYGFNRIGDIDKLLFDDKGQSTWLHFPPHTAKYVMGVAGKNAMATVSFHITNHKAADDKPMYDLLSVQSATGSFTTGALQPPAPANGKQIEIGGKILEYKMDEKGVVSGFIMDKYIIEIPKHMEQNIAPMLKAAKEISVKGYERNAGDGFINTTGFILVKPFAITIDKTYYLL